MAEFLTGYLTTKEPPSRNEWWWWMLSLAPLWTVRYGHTLGAAVRRSMCTGVARVAEWWKRGSIPNRPGYGLMLLTTRAQTNVQWSTSTIYHIEYGSRMVWLLWHPTGGYLYGCGCLPEERGHHGSETRQA